MRRLTAYSQDDGQEMGDLAFSADGALVFFVRGGDANRSGEYPNPTSNPEGGRQAVWAIRVAGRDPFRIGEGTDPVPSPADHRVVYILRGQIYLAAVNDKPNPQLLCKARGTCRLPAWSPDGTKLAFVSSRRGHSLIGIYDLSKASLRWVAPSVDQDSGPVFSPDGARLAFFRFRGTADSLSFSEGSSFEIMVADITSGGARAIWRCPDESGGFAQFYPASPLRWAGGQRLLFYSEHEGWMRIYSLPAEGGEVQGLTAGDSEVEDSVLSPDGKTLIFNSNSTGVDLHGVHDWMLDWRAEDRSWGSREEEMMRTAHDSSPVADVRFWSSPVLMVHGDDDRNVEFLQTIDLVQRLRREGKAHVETLVFPDEVHSFLLHRRWLEVFSAAADFFDRFLRNSGT